MNQPFIVNNNEKTQRFEIHEGAELAYLEYRYLKNDIVLMHTFVPEVLEAKGMASTLAHYGLEWAKEHQKPVIVYCPFVAAYLKKHTEYNSIIDKNYR